MKINVNSWHYRFVDWVHGDVPNSLCTYFWKLVVAFIVTPVGAALIEAFKMENGLRFIMLLILASLSIPLYTTAYFTGFYGGIQVTTTADGDHLYTELVPYAFVIATVYYFICICNMINFVMSSMFLCAILVDKYKSAHPKIRVPKGEGEGNIVKEFIKAKKNKYCPKLEFISDDEE